MSKTDQVISELLTAYWMEIETVQNYIAHAHNLDGVRAEEIKKTLNTDVDEELGHARSLAARVRVLGGLIPGSFAFRASQESLQPPKDSTDVLTVIRGVIDAEDSAIRQYQKIIELCEGEDYPTQDLCIKLLGDEQNHRREFVGFLAEYEK